MTSIMRLQSNDFLREIWKPRPLISAGKSTLETAMQRSHDTGELIAFGRMLTSKRKSDFRKRFTASMTRFGRGSSD